MAAVAPAPESIPPAISAAAVRDLEPGLMVGEYRVEGKLGQGGMATVYSATHPLIGKRAAIKVISPALCTDDEAIKRFKQEARSVNQIGHINIVDIFSFGTLPDGRSYFVMEWLQGESLGARLARGRLSLTEALEQLGQVCDALDAAHEVKIVHRDLKPDNVFLVRMRGKRPLVKLLDFGIAKLASVGDGLLNHTRTGMIMGTPGYISPEQARGRSVDHRTDIYALGAMAFEMVLGRLPFVADNAADTIRMHLTEPPPSPSSLWPDIPAGLSKLLLEMLEKEPDKRPTLPDIRALLAELRTLYPSEGESATGETTVRRFDSSSALPSPLPTPTPVALPPELDEVAEAAAPRRPWITAAVVGAVVGIVLLIALPGRKRETPVSVPPPAPRVSPPVTPRVVAADSPVAPKTPAPLPTPKGTLSIRINVDNARIEIDGQIVATDADGAQVQLEADKPHGVVISAPGKVPFKKTVAVGAEAKVEVAVKLRAVAAASPGRPQSGSRPQSAPSDGYMLDPFGQPRKK